MTDTYGSEINVGQPPVTLRKRRSFGLVGILAVLLIVGAAGGFAWLNLDTITDLLHGQAGSADGAGAHAGVLASASEPSVSAAEFASFQQQTSGSIQAATDVLNAQQTELKRLSDQIQGLTSQVAALTSKIDQLQGRATVSPAAASVAVPVAAAPVVTGSAPRAPAAPRKRAPTRPAGAISVGGAPLPTAPPR